MSRFALAILSTCLCVVAESPSGTAQTGGATVTGTVVAYASDEPIADATVTLLASTSAGNKISTQTDGKGVFVFANLSAGRYRLGVAKQGFLAVNAGEPRYRAGGRVFVLRDGERHDVRLRLPRLSVITGRILDERGNPVVGASVRASSADMSGGYRRIRSTSQATTDDRGLYRLHSLAPGRYVICAAPGMAPPPLDEAQHLQREIDYLRREAELTTGPRSDAARERAALLEPRLPDQVDPVRGFAPACHTEATGRRSTIDVSADEERGGLDIRFALTRLARIEGKVIGLTLDAGQAGTIRLANEDEELGDVREMARAFRDGRFFFRDVPPGRYAMVLTTEPRTGNPAPVRAVAAVPLVVADADLSGVMFEVPRAARIEGQVVLRGKADAGPTVLERIEIRVSPAVQTAETVLQRYAGPRSAKPDADGRFVLENVWPGAYRITAGARDPATWFTDAVILDGRDVALDTIDIAPGQSVKDVLVTLTDRRASLAGTVLDETGEPAPEFLILLYPTESRYWTMHGQRMRLARATPDGDYTITGLRPGAYRIATLRDVEFGAWFDPAFLRQLEPTSILVSIAGDGQTILNLRVASADR